MINVRIDMKFKPYANDQGLHLLNKKRVEWIHELRKTVLSCKRDVRRT